MEIPEELSTTTTGSYPVSQHTSPAALVQVGRQENTQLFSCLTDYLNFFFGFYNADISTFRQYKAPCSLTQRNYIHTCMHAIPVLLLMTNAVTKIIRRSYSLQRKIYSILKCELCTKSTSCHITIQKSSTPTVSKAECILCRMMFFNQVLQGEKSQ